MINSRWARFFPVLLGASLVVMVWMLIEPPLTRWVLESVADLSARHTPYRIQASNVSFGFIIPRLRIEQVSLKPVQQGDALPEIRVGAVEARLDFLQLVGGRFQISLLKIEGVDGKWDLDPWLETITAASKTKGTETATSKKTSTATDLEEKSMQQHLKILQGLPGQIFSWVAKIPVSRVALVEGNFQAQSQIYQSEVRVENLSLLLTAQRQSLQLGAQVEKVKLQRKNLSRDFDFSLSTTLTPKLFSLSSLELRSQGIRFQMRTDINDWENLYQRLQGQVSTEFAMDLKDLQSWFEWAEIPFSGDGQLTFATAAEFSSLRAVKGSGLVKTQNLSIYEYEVGSLSTGFDMTQDSLRVPLLKMDHSSGLALVRDLVLSYQLQPLKISLQKSKVEAQDFDLSQLLRSLHIEVPIELFVGTQLGCQGDLVPRFLLRCEGQVLAEELEVRTGNKFDDILVRVEKPVQVAGEFSVSSEDVRYKGKLEVGDTRGSSQGVINFQTGFSIDYSTETPLDLGYLGRISKFPVEGMVMVSGHTEGGSQSATFSLDLEGERVFFDNYALGTTSGRMTYKKGLLELSNFQGSIGSSQYVGVVGVNFEKQRLSASAQLKQFVASDLVRSIQRYLPFPLDVTGLGQAQVWLEGPLEPSLLSYRVQANLNRGTIFGESFDELDFQISANEGRMQADLVRMRKGKSLISLQGRAFPTGELDFIMRGEKLSLEDSENVSQLGSSISGNVDFSLDITGFLRKPEFAFKAKLGQLIIEDQEFPESQIVGRVDSEALEMRAAILGQRLNLDMRWPFENLSPFRFKAQAKDWDFSSLFALIGNATLVNEYGTSLTGEIDFSSATGGFKNSDGFLRISQFLLQRDQLLLANALPLEVTAKSGRFDIKNLALLGPQAKLSLAGPAQTLDQLQLNLQAQLPLRLLQIFFPFLEELGGRGVLDTRIAGSFLKPEILGQAQLQQGFLKIKNLPHPIEKLNASADFSKSAVLIPKIEGQLAGGQLSGRGQVEIRALKEWPLNLEIMAEGVNLNLPDRMQTSGKLDLRFTGSWFPFLLTGQYRVVKGFIDKEFGKDSSTVQMKASSYLPKVLLKSASDPLNLDLSIQLEKPVRVKNSLANAFVTGQLQVKGTPSAPQITGQVDFDKNSKIGYEDKTFDLNAGTIRFTNPAEIDPELYFSGRTRVNEFEVNILVQGFAKNPIIRLTSLPPLPEKEIISLLALGMTSSSMEKSLQTRETENNTNYRIGSALLTSNPVTKKIQESLGVDLDLSSSYDDKKNVAERKLTMSRRLSRKVKASASRLQKEQSSTEVKLEYSLTPTLSAVAAWEAREPLESRSATETQKQTESIFGLDLDFRREFK